VVMVNRFDIPAYVAMGIPDTLLPVVKSELGRTVQSSLSDGLPGVRREPAATKIWRRLEKQRAAVYDAGTDIFTLV